jgi:hypothetical protein
LFTQNDSQRCGNCGWRGHVYTCVPREQDESAGTPAMPGEAVCANHPDKAAVAVCAGSGDYICPLCRVKVAGADYSVQYIDRVDGEARDKILPFTLSRPDRAPKLMTVFSMLMPPFCPFFLIISIINVIKTRTLIQENALFRKVAGIGSPIFWLQMNIVVFAAIAYLAYLAFMP